MASDDLTSLGVLDLGPVKRRNVWSEGKSSIFMAAGNLSAAVVGSGILGLPFAMQNAGFVAGVLLLSLAAFMTYWGLQVLVVIGRRLGVKDLEDMANRTFGRPGYIALCVCLAINGLGSIISYLVISRETVPAVMGRLISTDSVFADKYVTTSILAGVVALPLSLAPDIRHLEYFSLFSLASVMFVTAVVVGHLIHYGQPNTGTESETHHIVAFHSKLLPSFGTITFAFVCHQLAFAIGRSLKSPTYRRWQRVAISTVVFAWVMLLTMGACGFFAFTDVKDNILLNLSTHSFVSDIARVCAGVHVLLAYPLEFYIVRGIVFKLMFPSFDTHPGAVFNPFLPRRSRCARGVFHVFITVLLWGITLGVALSGVEVCFVFELTGSTSAVMLAFVFPAATYLRAMSPDFMAAERQHARLLAGEDGGDDGDGGGDGGGGGGIGGGDGAGTGVLHMPRRSSVRSSLGMPRTTLDSARARDAALLDSSWNKFVARAVLLIGLFAFFASTGTTLYNEIVHGEC